MSPIDDELRAALRSRASVLTSSPDPLAGIERRAKRIRRNRLAASLTGTALAVAAIALAVPVLTPSAQGPMPPLVATQPPSPSAEPAPTSSPFGLDPADPWPYRGDPDVAVQGDLDAYTAEWAVRHDVLIDDVRLTPLFGQVYEPSATPELFYVASLVSRGASWWGVAQASESGPELVLDVPLARGTTALPAALPGDEVARLLVVASPEVAQIQYGPDAASEWATMTQLADGVAISPLEGDPATDQVRVLAADGEVLFQEPAPELANGSPSTVASPSPVAISPPVVSRSPVATSPRATPPVATLPVASPPVASPPVATPPGASSSPVAAKPDNLLGWPARGATNDALVERAAKGYAAAKGVSRDRVAWEVLFTGDNDPGQRYTILNAWVSGQRAQVFGWVESPGRAPEPVLQPVTQPGEPVVAILLTEIPGRTTDELIVVPQPRTGDVFYRTSADDEGRSVVVDGLDGIAMVDRERGAQGDRLFVLDGNGDLDNPTFDGTVFSLLCGEKGCG